MEEMFTFINGTLGKKKLQSRFLFIDLFSKHISNDGMYQAGHADFFTAFLL